MVEKLLATSLQKLSALYFSKYSFTNITVA